MLASLQEVSPLAPLAFEARVDDLSPSDLRQMARLDAFLQLGVESFSPRMVEIMKKARDGRRYVERAASVIDEANRVGLYSVLNILLNHPGETTETVEETVATVEAILESAVTLSVVPEPAPFAYFPGSEIAAHIGDYERRFGTLVRHPRWWHEPDHRALAQDVRASTAFEDYRPWMARLTSARQAFIERWSPATELRALLQRRRLVS